MSDRDSVVGRSTRYRLHGPGTESRYSRDFPRPSRPAWRLAAGTMGTESFPRLCHSKRDADDPPNLAPRLRMDGFIPPAPLCACTGMPWGDLENYFLGSRKVYGGAITDRYQNLALYLLIFPSC